jgi:quinoprotein glucose dehydrogenase
MLRSTLPPFALLLVGLVALATPPRVPNPNDYPKDNLPMVPAPPALPDGTDKARKQMAGFRLPKGMQAELFAAEPQLASPVAISVDERGRVFVAEEYRFNRGTEENRSRSFFLDDDLQVNTLADRLAMYQKHASRFEGGMAWFSKHADQVRLLEDTKGTGRADRSTVFAGGFNQPLDGLAAGILARDNQVWLTNIPNLWLLQDTKNAGTADVRKPLLTGFGVNCAFLGHDLHGLIFGPDGKLYFSIGDRGFDVTSQEGTRFHNPRTGAVFRCDPDGANLEVVMRGLRNPQELAFDQFGNLFADDNNCDKGDHARLVYVLEDADAGWNMAYQTIPAPYMAGPWFAERMWHLPHAGQPAWLLPPIGKIGTGPSGFLFVSGTSLPDRYTNSFLMANYTGGGGIEAFRLKPKGAAYEIDDYHDFVKPFQPTDVDLGPDGKLYLSDFIGLDWTGKSLGGRIYTVFDPDKLKLPVVAQTKQLFAEGFTQRPTPELVQLLAHPDQRIRQRAQFALAERKAVDALVPVARTGTDRFARLHAIWGLGQLAKATPTALAPVAELLRDADAEVVAQAARVLGTAKYAPAAAKLVELLQAPSPRVRLFAATALGKIGHAPALAPLFALLQENADADPFLRHAAVAALARLNATTAAAEHVNHASVAVRLAAVLVLRRARDERLSLFLTDADLNVRTEAARAIHDLNLRSQYGALADTLARMGGAPLPESDALARRAISAHFTLGQSVNAQAVLDVVVNANFSSAVRHEALAALRDWTTPPPRDRVTGFWRTLPPRDSVIVKGVVEKQVAALLGRTTGKLQAEAVALVGKLGVQADPATFAAWVADPQRDVSLRAAALRFLATQKAPPTRAAVQVALADASPLLRAEARDALVQIDAEQGLAALTTALNDDKAAISERQRALVTLAERKAAVLDEWANKLTAGTVPAELRLDVLEALAAAPTPTRTKQLQAFLNQEPTDLLGKHRLSLTGGDAERGRELFVGHAAAQCIRCHVVNGMGGNAGPDLSKVASKYPDNARSHFLESLLLPSAKLADGYANVTLTRLDGRVVAGVVLKEDKQSVTLKTPDDKPVTIAVSDIETRVAQPSAMPAMDKTLTARELRDVVEYLTTLK